MRQTIRVCHNAKSQLIKIVVTAALVGAQTGCKQSSSGLPPATVLTDEQTVELVSRWVNVQSPQAVLKFVSRSDETDSVTVQLRITDFEFRDPLKLRPDVYTGPAEAQFKWRNPKWALARFVIGPGTASSHSWDGLHVTDAYTPIEQPTSQQGDVGSNENVAIANVRRLVTAELTYLARNHNTCGTIKDLIGEDLIDGSYASGNIRGYRLSIKDVGNTCGVLATPRSFGVTGVRSFYAPVVDGFIRYTTDGSFPTEKHPRLQ